jgi:hypothetical protein
MLQAALALLCSLAFPELSFLFVVPVAAGLLGALLALRVPARSHGSISLPPLAVALPVCGAAVTLLPSVLMTYPALGASAWPIITAVCGLIALGLAPLLGDARARSYRASLLLATFAVIAGALVTALQGAYSLEMPQRTLLWYALDADSGAARWILQPDSKRSAPQLAFDAAQERHVTSLPLGIVSGVDSAPAPRLDYAPPQLDIIDSTARGADYAWHLRLRSPRAAAELALAIPRGVIVKSLAVLSGAERVPAKLWRAPDGTGWLDLVGATGAGVELELVAPDSNAFSFRLLDRSYGLPAAGAALRQPGPALTTASRDGDLSIVYRSITLGPGTRQDRH